MRRRQWSSGTLLILGTAICFVLGLWGYARLPDDGATAADKVFRTLQLFAIDVEAPPGGVPWQLEFARFLAPVVLVSATLVAVARVLRDEAQRLWVRLYGRQHVVLIGLNPMTAALAASLSADGRRTVFLDSNPTDPLIATVRSFGARVLVGDARSPDTLRDARLGRAAHIVVMTGDDLRNLEIADEVRRVAGSPTRALTVHVAVGHLGLWRRLARMHVGRPRGGVQAEFFDVADRAALALVDAVEAAGDGNELYVEGDGPLVQRVLCHLARRSHLAGARPCIWVNLPPDDLQMVLEDDPWVGVAADLRPLDEMQKQPPPGCRVAVVCRTTPDLDTVARALDLATAVDAPRVVLSSERSLPEDFLGVSSGNLVVVPRDPAAMARDLLQQSGVELMARVRHDAYCRAEEAKGAGADNPSCVPWDDLPDSLKLSNRRFAAAVGQVVDEVGGVLVPLTSLTHRPRLVEDAQLLERLARGEHDRWMADLLRDGWRHGPGRKDPLTKTHPLLVPWSGLEEAEREKDRDAIRAVPDMLARVGYQVELAHPDQVAEPGGLR